MTAPAQAGTPAAGPYGSLPVHYRALLTGELADLPGADPFGGALA